MDTNMLRRTDLNAMGSPRVDSEPQGHGEPRGNQRPSHGDCEGARRDTDSHGASRPTHNASQRGAGMPFAIMLIPRTCGSLLTRMKENETSILTIVFVGVVILWVINILIKP